MSHDKIKAAARKRMAETGESYTAARRAVTNAHHEDTNEDQAAHGQNRSAGAKWFAISYSNTWSGKLSNSLDRLLFRSGHGVSGVEVDAGQIRVRMGSFKLDIPRGSVRAVERSQANVRGTIGVHGGRGRWLVNGSAEGLVELVIDPPGSISPGPDTLFGLVSSRVNQLTVSLDDPDGFIEAVRSDANAS